MALSGGSPFFSPCELSSGVRLTSRHIWPISVAVCMIDAEVQRQMYVCMYPCALQDKDKSASLLVNQFVRDAHPRVKPCRATARRSVDVCWAREMDSFHMGARQWGPRRRRRRRVEVLLRLPRGDVVCARGMTRRRQDLEVVCVLRICRRLFLPHSTTCGMSGDPAGCLVL